MKNLFSIGEMQRMTGVSVSALRFYSEMGLIKPAHVDENTGYRYYSYEHFWQIELIKMCRDMQLPLKGLQGILEKQDEVEFQKFMTEQRIHAQAEAKRLKKVAADISWLEKQWKEKQKLQKGPLMYKRMIPERTVIAAYWEESFCNDALHLKLQQMTHQELDHSESIKRHYGYILRRELFLQNRIDTLAEYLEMDDYPHTPSEQLLHLPAGEYACFITKIFSDDADMSSFLQYLQEHRISADKIYASEVAFTFFDWRECLFEVQVFVGPAT